MIDADMAVRVCLPLSLLRDPHGADASDRMPRYRASMLAPPLAELVAAFRACAIPHREWTHGAHLRIGAWHVYHHGGDAALPMLRSGIRQLNDRHGTPNSPTSGYHETITAAYVRLIEGFLATFDEEVELEHRAAELVAGPLGDRSLLFRFWSRDLLMAARARAEWVAPDLAPLELPPEILRADIVMSRASTDRGNTPLRSS